MTVRYDPLVTARLSHEIQRGWGGRAGLGLSLDPDRRLGLLRFEEEPHLLFLLHPEAGHVLPYRGKPIVPGIPPGGATRGLEGLRLAEARSPADERLLVLGLEPAEAGVRPRRLVAELATNQWNLLLLAPREDRAAEDGDEDGEGERRWIVQAVLWPREAGRRVLRPGAPYRPFAGERKWRHESPDPEEWRRHLAGLPPEKRRAGALRSVAYLSSLNVDYVLGGWLSRDEPVGEKDAAGEAEEESAVDDREAGDAPLEESFRRYRELRDLVAGEHAGDVWLHDRSWGRQPYPHPLGRQDAPTAPSFLEAAKRLAREFGVLARFLEEAVAGPGTESPEGPEVPEEPEPTPAPDPELERLREALEGRRDRLRRRISALKRELERGPDPDDLREIGNLLLARLDRVSRGQSSVELEDFHGETREVELDPRLAPAENARRYYDEAAKRERAAEKVPREIARADKTLRRVERALEALDGVEEMPEGETADRLWDAAGGRPEKREREAEERGERLPYRKLVSSGGLEIRVGRGAESNEELTFHHSHTEDIWLHARDVPGAHVILRWGRREQNPPRQDLLEAAVTAAVHSDARHSGTVGVDWTRRKYVRSPRKSPPGVVVPRNVETIFVKPDEKLVKGLRQDR